jgi:putative ABC transport system permease protein
MGTMRDAVADAVAAPRFLTLLVGLFGVLALLLATVGVYGVVAYVVGQRTNEIGVRMALGARSGDIVAWTLRTGMTPVVVGLALGVAASLGMSRALAAQLYEVSPNDPVVFASVALILATVSLLASGVPAFRAARVDPTVALRG